MQVCWISVFSSKQTGALLFQSVDGIFNDRKNDREVLSWKNRRQPEPKSLKKCWKQRQGGVGWQLGGRRSCDRAAVQEGASSFTRFPLHCTSHSLFHSYIICLTLEMLTQAHLIIANISTNAVRWLTTGLTLSEPPGENRLARDGITSPTGSSPSNLHHIT